VPVPRVALPRIVDHDVAARAAAADAEYERLVNERRRVLQERWLTSGSPTVNTEVRTGHVGTSRPLPIPPSDSASAAAFSRPRAAAPVGADPYYRPERLDPRPASLWDRMREFWARAKAVGE
jgi:hypothetical protein